LTYFYNLLRNNAYFIFFTEDCTLRILVQLFLNLNLQIMKNILSFWNV